MKSALVSGASVAGPVLAYWLTRNGYSVTVVERAPALRSGGQALDIRGTALDVVDRMGLLPQARAAGTHMRGMSVLDPDGAEVHRSTEATFSSGRLDNGDIEILREDLTDLFYEATRADVEYVFADSIATMTEEKEGVRVTFEQGASRTFDIVVGADGLHSTVRRLAFGPEADFLHPLGTHLAIFSADNFLGLDNWQMWLRDGNAGYGIYPVRDNTELRVTCGFHSDLPTPDYRDVAAQKAFVAAAFADLRWETPRLMKAMQDAPDLYCDVMAQIHMERWSRGRIVLLGDAGYCPSPLSGQGTSLALVGAYVLAAELGRSTGSANHIAAFARYEERMRPFVVANQALATENPGGPASEESVERAKNTIKLDAQVDPVSVVDMTTSLG